MSQIASPPPVRPPSMAMWMRMVIAAINLLLAFYFGVLAIWQWLTVLEPVGLLGFISTLTALLLALRLACGVLRRRWSWRLQVLVFLCGACSLLCIWALRVR